MTIIITSYKKPTSTRGARVIAYSPNGPKRMYAWNYALTAEANHAFAARQYAHEHHLEGAYVFGEDDKSRMVFIRATDAQVVLV